MLVMLVMSIETPDSERVSPILSSTLLFLSVLCQELRITKELSRPTKIEFKIIGKF